MPRHQLHPIGWLVLLSCHFILTAEDVSNLPGPEATVPELGGPPVPGRAEPHGMAQTCVVRFVWADSLTVVVVGSGTGRVKPAWVATYDHPAGTFAVAYRATAFRDARGFLHIDARHAEVVGPRAMAWSPDSFAFGRSSLWTLDDMNPGHVAEMGTLFDGSAAVADYRRNIRLIQSLVEGGL